MKALVRIESLTEADVAEVLAIEGPTQMSEESLRDELRRSWSRMWVAKEAATGVAAFLVSWHVADELHVLNVATRADRRRRGMARALMDEVVRYAGSHRLRHVLLEVRRSNVPAIALYRSVGFFAMGIRARYYADDEDAVEMMLQLHRETGAVVPHADEVKLER